MQRVVQFSSGNVGRHSLRAIIGRPDLQLVGLHAASPNKIGRDAAELCGLDEPTGVVATDDIDALIALKPDCVVYTAQGETRPMEAIEQMAKFLAAGVNVTATSMVWLVTPRQADDWLRLPLEQACEAGDASLYVNGIDPGYSGDTRGAQCAEPRHSRQVDHRPGDLRLCQLRRLRVHGQINGFRYDCRRRDADALPAGRPDHDVAARSAISPTSSAWNSTRSVSVSSRGTPRRESNAR